MTNLRKSFLKGNRIKTLLTIVLIVFCSSFSVGRTTSASGCAETTFDNMRTYIPFICSYSCQADAYCPWGMCLTSEVTSYETDTIHTPGTFEFLLFDTITYCDSLSIYKDTAEEIRQDLIDEVSGYISSVAPKSRMSAEHIVDKCIEHEFDITLLMSQAHVETHFSQTSRSNNTFGLSKKSYRHPNNSVEDYISLMQRRYVKNRTTEQALAANMNVEGTTKYKYSSNPQYGKIVRNVRDKIIAQTQINDLFNELLTINSQISQMTEAII